MPELRVTYDDFSGGDYGRLGGRKAPANTFSGSNVLVYRDGLLGPRAGLSDISPSGLPVGKAWGYSGTPVPGKDGLILIGTALYYWDGYTPGAAAVLAGNVAVAPDAPVAMTLDTTTTYFTIRGDKVYSFNSAGTLAGHAGTPGGRAIAFHGGRLVVGDIVGSGMRIMWSAPFDFTTFPAANFADIGDNWQVTGLYSQRDHLLVLKQQGLYVVRGTLGDGTIVRRVATRNGPYRQRQGVITARGILWFQGLFDNFPTSFDGAVPREEAHRQHGTSPGSDVEPADQNGVASLPDGNEYDGAILVDGSEDKALLFHNGVWTYHTFTQPISGMMDTASTPQGISICDGGGTGVVPKVWNFRFDLNRPGIEGGAQFQRAGDGSATPVNAQFTLPEWWSPPGQEVRVRQVVVDFVKWNTQGSVANNNITLDLKAFGLFRNDGTEAAAVQSWSEAGALSTTAAEGTRDRTVFNVGGQGYGAGFQVGLLGLVGVAIRSITVVVDTQASSPRH